MLAQIAQAQAVGVSSVPTYVFEGRWAVSGAQESSTFLRVLEQVAAESAVEEGQSDADGDGCVDGACAV